MKHPPSHVRCRCGSVYPLREGRGLCPRCVSLTPPRDRMTTEPTSEPEERA